MKFNTGTAMNSIFRHAIAGLALAALLIFSGSRVLAADLPQDLPAVAAEPPADGSAPLLVRDLRTGSTMELAELKGKLVLINFWATWCPPCVAEMPSLEQLYQKYGKNKDVVFLLVSFDGSPDKALQFMEKNGYSLPVHMLAAELPADFQSQGIPTTFLIAPSGEVAWRQLGMANFESPDFEELFSSLLP